MTDRHRNATDRTWTLQVNDDGRTATARFGDEVKTVPIQIDENGKHYVQVTFGGRTFSTREPPRNIRDFITAQLDREDRAAREAAQAIGDGVWGSARGQVRSTLIALVATSRVSDFIALHDPNRVLHDIASARGVLARHTNDPTSKYDELACIGCPTSEIDGGYTVDDIADCPELQDLAWRWHTAEGWDIKWCPHYESYLVKETPDPQHGPFSLKFCTHCGAILGRVYEADTLKQAALGALGLDPSLGVIAFRLSDDILTLALSDGTGLAFAVRAFTDEQRAAVEAYVIRPGGARDESR